MDPSESTPVDCPYYGESLEITVDTSVGQQDDIEDGQVCCNPMQCRIRVSADGQSRIDARSEDES